jgi:hypothetical protein
MVWQTHSFERDRRPRLVGSIAIAVEEPPFKTVLREGEFEIRDYLPLFVAEVAERPAVFFAAQRGLTPVALVRPAGGPCGRLPQVPITSSYRSRSGCEIGTHPRKRCCGACR